MHEYARQFLASTAAQLLPCRGSSIKTALVRQFLPYCLGKLGDGRYVLLNREYKPLGWPTRRRGRVDYDDPMFESMRVHVPRYALDELPAVETKDGTFLYLYGSHVDIDPPWKGEAAARAYLHRLGDIIEANSLRREGVEP